MTPNVDAWNHPDVLMYFAEARSTTDHVYPSEWFFIRDNLREGVRILDVGCAQGGFAAVAAEHLKKFDYTGVDSSSQMISRAQTRFPQHRFHVVRDGEDSVLGDAKFDLVLVLGILHLHEAWRETLAAAWRRTCGTLIFDLRETHLGSIEDKTKSWFVMDPYGTSDAASRPRLPYIVLNSGEALGLATSLCSGHRKLSRYGYLHGTAPSATVPVPQVMMSTYCVER